MPFLSTDLLIILYVFPLIEKRGTPYKKLPHFTKVNREERILPDTMNNVEGSIGGQLRVSE